MVALGCGSCPVCGHNVALSCQVCPGCGNEDWFRKTGAQRPTVCGDCRGRKVIETGCICLGCNGVKPHVPCGYGGHLSPRVKESGFWFFRETHVVGMDRIKCTACRGTSTQLQTCAPCNGSGRGLPEEEYQDSRTGIRYWRGPTDSGFKTS